MHADSTATIGTSVAVHGRRDRRIGGTKLWPCSSERKFSAYYAHERVWCGDLRHQDQQGKKHGRKNQDQQLAAVAR